MEVETFVIQVHAPEKYRNEQNSVKVSFLMRHKYLYEDFKGQRLLYNVEGNM